MAQPLPPVDELWSLLLPPLPEPFEQPFGAASTTLEGTASLLDQVHVDAYGAKSPLTQVAAVSVPEPRSITVSVWDKGMAISVEKAIRNAGLGIIVEYANVHRQPQWVPPPHISWDYTIFGNTDTTLPPPDQTIDMIFEKIPGGSGKFNSWLVNGKQYPHDREFVLKQGARYRLVFRNRTDDAHPLHLHRHQLELVEFNGKKTAGLIKDTVVVPYYGRAAVDFVADQPGLSLFHCHIQQHMDYGFKALFRYA